MWAVSQRDDQKLQKEIEDYIRERGLEIEEVTGDV